ncbi:MAG: DUF2062 domain-containing protein [Phycisphaerae bacterium]|nr:DUF2062 domain-containing protein [Phycisphaerae bacterium]
MPVIKTFKFIFSRVEQFFVYRVLSLKDTPHRIALGVAIGIFITWTPTIGLQMLLTVALATLLRANKLVGVPFVWISNPLTIFPIYGPSLLLGQWVTGKDIGNFSVLRKATSFEGGIFGRITAWFGATAEIFTELWIGSLIVALLLGILTYFAMYRMIVVYRRKFHDWQIRHAAHKKPLPKPAAGEETETTPPPGP